jgi:hypothetical protein
MIRERLLKDLAHIERHLTRGEDAIARQEQIVAELEQLGQAGLEQKARQVLATFRELQNAYLRDLGRLRREIGHEGLESSDDRAVE